MHHIKTILLCGTLFLAACTPTTEELHEDAIVKVNTQTLLKQDIESLIPAGMKENDSIDLAQKYISKWVIHQLLIDKARFNVGYGDPEIEKMVSEYRNSLIIKKYKEQILEQKAEIDPTPEEIEQYYEINAQNYPLTEELVQGIYIRLPLDAPKLKDLRKWLEGNSEDNFLEIEGYSYQNATNYDDFRDRWMAMKTIESMLPEKIKRMDDVVRGKRFEEQSDTVFTYFFKAVNFKAKNDTAPLQYVEQNIVTILRHQKKLAFFKNLEKDIYNEGIKNETVIFNPAYE